MKTAADARPATAAPGCLSLNFLGPPQVVLPGGETAMFSVDNSLLLLAYLAADPSRAPRRDELAALFYPDQNEKHAGQNLRQTLLRLRRAIRDETADPPYLIASQLSLQFNAASRHRVDVTEFDALLSATRMHRHRRLEVCRECMARLARAVELYRGDFLSGAGLRDDFPYMDWLQTVRDDLRRRAVNALQVLAQHHMDRGQLDLSEAYTARLLRMDSLDEAALRLQMQALALRGERSQALRCYQEFKQNLLAELDAAPDPETVRLARVLQSNQPLDDLSRRVQHRDTLLTSQDFSPSALPNTLVPLVDRQAELRQISEWLASRDCRLITLTGPGGCGKTRLAMRAAADEAGAWAHGVWLALLDDASAAGDLETTLANALGIPVTARGSSRLDVLNHLRDKETLLLLDNFERVVGQAGLVKSLLDHAPRLKVLLTSRQRLGIRGEQVIELRGLDFPGTDEFESPGNLEPERLSREYAAIRLFIENARRARPDFELDERNAVAVARICRAVDGLPLAIELASAWVRVLPCDQILERLEQNIDFLMAQGKDVPQRHSSPRAVFEYSWKLLTAAERSLLKRLSVFRGHFSQDAAAQVAGGEIHQLANLCDKSLVRDLPGGGLDIHPLLRPYACQKLAQEPDEARGLHARHCSHFLTFIATRAAALAGQGDEAAMAEIRREAENVAAAWEWAAGDAGQLEAVPESLLARALEAWLGYLEVAGHSSEAKVLVDSLAGRLKALPPSNRPAQSPTRIDEMLSRTPIPRPDRRLPFSVKEAAGHPPEGGKGSKAPPSL